MKFKRRIVFATFFLFLCFFNLSCTEKQAPVRINLDDSFYTALYPQADCYFKFDSTLQEAKLLEFSHLDKMEFRNLRRLYGKEKNIVWLKTEFTIPEGLKNQKLSMIIPYLHFADELYLNDKYISSYGIMDEDALQAAGFRAQVFDFPEDALIQDGINTVYIKVFSLGLATISSGVFVGTTIDVRANADLATFWQSRIYFPFEGVMFAAIIIFIILYFSSAKKEKIYLYFALINIFSFLFFTSFFQDDIPQIGFHGNISYFTFIKITRAISFYGMSYLSVLFIFKFLKIKHHKIDIIMRSLCSSFCIIFTIAAPDYYFLMKFAPMLLGIASVDLVASFFMILGNLRYQQKRRLGLYLLIGASPLILSLLADFVLKIILNNISVPYISMLGWQGTIIFFFIYFSVQYRKISVRLEYLNTELENEVEIRTRQLTLANEKLDNEMQIAQADVRTAAVVQQKLFHPPETDYPNWDISVAYQPLAVVSGDFYNFYSLGSVLYGVSLFDASGHGVAASLITMLAENIIQQNFRDANIYGEDISVTLERINGNFITAKGEIENYMTGLLLNIRELEDGCEVSLVDAAHPYPEFYHSEEKYVEEILPDAENPSFGPIGMDLLNVHYSPISLKMKKDDVLVLFTDGLVEAMNENREEFGRAALKGILNGSENKSSQEILQEIQESLTSFVGSASRTDDVTIIVMKRK